MRIALLVDPSADPVSPQELAARPGARILALPPSARFAHALASAMHTYGAGSDAVLVIQPAGEGFVEADVWDQHLATEAIDVDDSAAIEGRLAEASRALDEGRIDDASAGYSYCNALLAGEVGPRRAEVLACLGQIADMRRHTEEAAHHLDHALAIFPAHRGALSMRLHLARRSGDHAVAAALTERMLAFATGDDERVALLTAAADDGLRVAVDMMQAALGIRPNDALLLDRLRAVHEASADWSRAVDVAVAAAEQLRDPQARALAFVEAAALSAARARNVGRAVALYEAAIADDPEVPGAFEAIEKVLLDAGDHPGAERAYVRQLARLKGRGAAEAALLDKLARVRQDHLGDSRGAIEALDRLAVLRPDDVETRTRLADLLEAKGEDALAIKCLEVAAIYAPTRPETFRAMARIFQRTQDADRGYCACGVLVHLGEADLDEQMNYQQFAPEVAVRPAQPLDDSAWDMLLPSDLDPVATGLFAAIAPAAIAARVEQLRAKKQLPRVEPAERQDVERTTVSAVRTVGWVSRLLGVPTPTVYVRPHDVPGGAAMMQLVEPSVALGPSILSGRPVSELAFLFARELTHLRLTSRVLTFYPTVEELRTVVTAAVSLVMGRPGSQATEIEKLARELGPRLDTAHKSELAAAVRSITDRGGQLDLQAWLRAVERAACRAGLLACGDLTVAARVLSVDGRVVGGMSAAERLRDLVPFSVSPRYSGLRSMLGIAARTSQVG